MSVRKDVVATYIEGLRRGDHSIVLGGLADDIVWEIYDRRTNRSRPTPQPCGPIRNLD